MQTGQKGKGGMPMNRKGLAAKLVKLNHITHKIVLFIAQASILAMVAIVTLTVILRYCFNTGLSWAEEVPRLLVTVFAFIACAIGVRDHMHVAVNAIYNKFPVGGKARKALDVLKGRACPSCPSTAPRGWRNRWCCCAACSCSTPAARAR